MIKAIYSVLYAFKNNFFLQYIIYYIVPRSQNWKQIYEMFTM